MYLKLKKQIKQKKIGDKKKEILEQPELVKLTRTQMAELVGGLNSKNSELKKQV